jgi:hypothetical protein
MSRQLYLRTVVLSTCDEPEITAINNVHLQQSQRQPLLINAEVFA